MQQASRGRSCTHPAWIPCVAFWVGLIWLHGLGIAGELYRWTDDQGRIHFSDQPPAQGRELKVYGPREDSPPLEAEPPKEDAGKTRVRPRVAEPPRGDPGRTKVRPMQSGDAIIVEARVNRKLTAPLLLDTGASYTVLTKQTAQALGIPAIERLPKQTFHTGGGVVLWPVTTLQSVRVGTAEVRDVEISIDMDGHLRMGLLGMTFLRHFKVIVDREQGQVRFER